MLINVGDSSTRLLQVADGAHVIERGPHRGDEFVQRPVLAWALLENGHLAPITVAGIVREPLAILHSDGRVEEPKGRIFASFDEFRANYTSALCATGGSDRD